MSAVKRRKVSAAGPPVPAAKPKYDLLYDRCVAEKGIGALFSTQALLDMDVLRPTASSSIVYVRILSTAISLLYRKRGNVVEYRTRAKGGGPLKVSLVTCYLYRAPLTRIKALEIVAGLYDGLHNHAVSRKWSGAGFGKKTIVSKRPTFMRHTVCHQEASRELASRRTLSIKEVQVPPRIRPKRHVCALQP